MSIKCTRCDGTGILNLHQVDDEEALKGGWYTLLYWMMANKDHDVTICDCCGDTESWHGEPGGHYNDQDPQGEFGPYAYNGGLCECH